MLGVAAVLLPGCRPKAQQEEARAAAGPPILTVYVPCGMELPFMGMKDAFEAAEPGTNVNIVLDNANILVKRILDKGERADLIVSPGTVEMEKMVEGDAVRSEDIRHFARYELVLFGPRANPGGLKTFADLAKPQVKTIAIADPDENSVGRYTRQALTKMGLWESLQDKIIKTDHPITAYKHVAREKAEASLAYRSCPLKTAPEKLEYSKVRIIESVPRDLYGPAYACIAVLKNAAQRGIAERFVQFLLSDAGRELLTKYDVPALTPLKLFVPCGMIGPFFSIKGAFEAQQPDVTLELVFDRADALTDRIVKQGESPDVHFSIGKIETDLLVQGGHVEAGTSVPFGTFQLALCAHVSRLDILSSVQDLTKPEVKSILLTPPENSSVGFYAKAALKKLGLWEKLQSKISYLPTIKDCYKDVSAGKVDASFAYVGCPIPCDPEKAKFSKVKTIQVLDEGTYGGATTFASVLKESSHKKEAAELVAFLKRPEVLKLLAKVGLRPVL